MTRQLAEALAAARFHQLPPPVIAETRRAVLDWLGSALAGSLEKPAIIARQVAAGFGASDEATVFSGPRAAAPVAAFANGVASHILEYDDIHKGSTVHAAAPVIPAALAVAQREHSAGRDFLLAVAVGYEAAFRIGEAVNPSHYRFWHPTGTVATFGAAAAAASLVHLDPARTLDALGTAGTQAAGFWEFNADGAMSKHLHPGKAAMNGVLSADLARHGFTSATRILEGDRGFFAAMSLTPDPTRITDGLGERWKIVENCYKIHSCCAHTHTAIDAALALCPPAADVAEIHIETYGPGYEIVREMRPVTPYQAQFSLAYCVAVALADGRAGLAQFSDPARPEIAALLDRTRVTVAPDLTAKYPAAWPVRLRLVLRNGTQLTGAANFPRGNPENPVTTAELEAKFRDLVIPRFGEAIAQRALNAIHNLDAAPDMAAVFCDLVP